MKISIIIPKGQSKSRRNGAVKRKYKNNGMDSLIGKVLSRVSRQHTRSRLSATASEKYGQAVKKLKTFFSDR